VFHKQIIKQLRTNQIPPQTHLPTTMTDNNDNLESNNHNDQNAASRQFYNRCLSQFATAAILKRQLNSRSPAATNDGDERLRWIVPSSKLQKSNTQSFHMLETPSRCLPEPCLHLTGSYGNEYKVTFASNNISCSCDDTPNPCKHVLFIVQRLGVKITAGLNTIDPFHIMHLLETVLLHRHMLDPKTTTLCLAYTSGKCGLCPRFLKGTSSICFNCAFIVHTSCVPDKPFHCPQRRQPWQGIPIPFEGKHRNFHHILRHCRHPVADMPTHQKYPTHNRRRPRPIQQRPPQHHPIRPPPHNPNVPLALPVANNSSSSHLIPGLPDKKIRIQSTFRTL
jgi:hypothetical protein